MAQKKKDQKPRLHPRNKNRDRYDLKALIEVSPELADFVKPNLYGDDSVDFSNADAVRILNTALLKHYYSIKHWLFPLDNLCPAIPGRADYIHYAADLLGEYDEIPTGDQITVFDIGVGASCIYPIIGVTEYGWKFIGSDIDQKSIDSANNIIQSNPGLKDKIEVQLQGSSKDVFFGVIRKEDKIDLAICNPPFHASAEEALIGSKRKVKNLTGKKTDSPELNFAGISSELVCEGGESMFIKNMIKESVKFSENFLWFTTLVSKQSNLKSIYTLLDNYGAVDVRTTPMGTGNKSSRIVAWSFLNEEQQAAWRESRWSKNSDESLEK